ncbi:protein belonging to Hydrogenase expression/formation protein, HupF/HypC [Candidatus Omnitrophus magneticus]|uniref:Protein belonging to Hydrogenase expression/formation protein, HupF/HypC n=1 Tax=Candidatus Omnitrophus magneticus TaxID=1609969 RepID=A0A0F0CUB9_9BACT|nr:protein belonging to Hydrogenase expression/formation protein, HupF/HypC [Candidatus Omnitrophus magneticus]
MCWAIPAKVVEIKGKTAKVELGGAFKDVSLALMDNISNGDYVLVHAGFVIQKVDPENAKFTIEFFEKEGNVDA